MLAPVFHLAFSERDHNKTNPVTLLLIGTKSLSKISISELTFLHLKSKEWNIGKTKTKQRNFKIPVIPVSQAIFKYLFTFARIKTFFSKVSYSNFSGLPKINWNYSFKGQIRVSDRVVVNRENLSPFTIPFSLTSRASFRSWLATRGAFGRITDQLFKHIQVVRVRPPTNTTKQMNNSAWKW